MNIKVKCFIHSTLFVDSTSVSGMSIAEKEAKSPITVREMLGREECLFMLRGKGGQSSNHLSNTAMIKL